MAAWFIPRFGGVFTVAEALRAKAAKAMKVLVRIIFGLVGCWRNILRDCGDWFFCVLI